ncbi:MAG: 3-oxoacyl-ACP synthase [Flavobacteriaceae bacterium]|nr:3-oxoacyl-ACP synthase [Flavobacteriaceae bacterium]
MLKKTHIQKYCSIKNNEISVNGDLVFSADTLEVKDFFKDVYQFLEIKYSKYFKMDLLSKLAFLSAEIILNEVNTKEKNTAIILSNNASSLETDRKYQNSINDKDNYFPSPAVFVYTLPNIGIGEISIRHQLKSENGFFVFEKYNANFHYNYEKSLLQNNKCESVLAGWVNIDKNSYEAFLYLVSEKGIIEHTEQNLKQLYNT